MLGVKDGPIGHALFTHADRVLIEQPVDLVHVGVFAAANRSSRVLSAWRTTRLRYKRADVVALASAILRVKEGPDLTGGLCLGLVQYLHFEPEHRRFCLIFHIRKAQNPLFQQVSWGRFRFSPSLWEQNRKRRVFAPGDALIPGFGEWKAFGGAEVLRTQRPTKCS
jgi:hypothetical protein